MDKNPLQCLVLAEERRGHCKIIIKGKVPDDLTCRVSEILQDPTEETATWSFSRPRAFTCNVKDSKASMAGAKKNANTEGKDKKFSQLYLKFESVTDCVIAA